jgi:pimeloyl-ACP methyl ester carboxylesterase
MTTNRHVYDRTETKRAAADRRRAIETAVAAGGVSLVALLTGVFIPFGPITNTQVWIVMLSSLGIGLFAGWLTRTSWAMLLAPLTYILIFELVRYNGLLPTTGALRLDNSYGLLALIMGRGFHGLVGLLPMVLGAGLGLYLVRDQSGQPAGTGSAVLKALPLVIMGIVVVAVAVLNAIPARTPPILDADGEPVPGSIAELTAVSLGGQEQTIMVRAYSPELPVLLYLSGGPGHSDLPYSRVLLEDITQDFVVVSWDQRGAGKSYPALAPVETLTLDQAVADTIELTNYLRQRFDEEKIYLMGESWGTTLGVLAVQQQPELFHAWIASGQMVSQRETDRQLYRDILALAARNGDTELAEQMTAFGEPPYADTPYPNAVVMAHYDALGQPYTPPQDYIERGTAANLGPWALFGSEYNLVEKVNVLRGLIDTFTIMYPQIQEIEPLMCLPRAKCT